MNLQKINGQKSVFESIKQVNDNAQEFWSARKLAKILAYLEFRNFLPVINKAKEACFNSVQKVEDHFVDMHEMVEIILDINQFLQVEKMVLRKKPLIG